MEHAVSHPKFLVLVWTPRISASLSLFGSVLTLVSLARASKKHRFETVYSRLLAAMSVYDVVLSVGWAMGITMTPTETGLSLARGNLATCTFQGALIQFGGGSFVYSLFLTIYYVLTIRYNIREQTLARRFEPFVHTGIFVCFLTSSVVGILFHSFYSSGGPVCTYGSRPLFCDQLDVMKCISGAKADTALFWATVVPFCAVSVTILLSLTIVVLTVVQVRGKAQKRSLQRYNSSSLLPQDHSYNPQHMFLPIIEEAGLVGDSDEEIPSSPTRNPTGCSTFHGPKRAALGWNCCKPTSNTDSQTKLVTTQCILYGITFFNATFWQTVVLLLMIMNKGVDTVRDLYWVGFWMNLSTKWRESTTHLNLHIFYFITQIFFFAFLLFPLQGFFNHVIHIRPRVLTFRRDYPEHCWLWQHWQAIWNPSAPRPPARLLGLVPEDLNQQRLASPSR